MPAAKPGATDRRIQFRGDTPYRDPDGMGAFRTVCDYSHMNFDDPLVYPGQRNATHLHVFFGNTATDANSTPESIRTSGGSSCRGGIVNRSSYWVPAMIDTRDGRPIQPRSDIDVYYKTGYLLGTLLNGSVQPFPAGFRMIGGDSKSRVAQRHMYYSCHNGSGDSPTIPNCPGGELWQIVEFPQCWDGRNLDSPDHRSHVVYPSGGRCPASHPVMLPQVSYHVKYDVPASGASTWRLSSDIDGAPAGSSGHGDWVNGWEQEVMETFVSRIVNLGLSGGSHIVGDGRIIY
ncbi:MAG TPA: DUF1996 domain-containing protein [Methylibium sp.]|uniref:DUF1996 domain-containing protein n=1 Tax=Methylibium sp. TaxID=2067992 RepID=UPI002DB73411|nr:DUF1996 domain-containing protein [Methylibium sp.]HEU4459263.1 DUF1996 domain-containing protein [Methylibium sp.]